MKVLVIGSGYVGLVAAVGFAESGHAVLGIDVDAAKVESLSKAISPIYEPGLQELLAKHLASGALRFSLDLKEGIADADAVFICVGTPQSSDGSADLKYVLTVASQIGDAAALRPVEAKPLIVVDKSTVPVGTSARVHAVIAGKTDRAFEVVSNPEFLREGTALDDFLYPDRVVVGCRSAFSESVMHALYEAHLLAASAKNPNTGKWFSMDPASAEITKYAANAMLALRISFMNEISGLCEAVGADVTKVKDGIGSDRRIGPYFLNPGPGFGGSCFPKDLQALLKVGREHGKPLLTLSATVEANRNQKQVLGQKVRAHYGATASNPTPLAGLRFALWGLAFKAHTDDIRESMALELIENLTANGAQLVVHDYEAMPNVQAKIGDTVIYTENPLEACKNADALIIATEWPQYTTFDMELIANLMKAKVIFDGRNLFQVAPLEKSGWTYYSLGRQTLPKN